MTQRYSTHNNNGYNTVKKKQLMIITSYTIKKTIN